MVVRDGVDPSTSGFQTGGLSWLTWGNAWNRARCAPLRAAWRSSMRSARASKSSSKSPP